jgi:hypothetical protein
MGSHRLSKGLNACIQGKMTCGITPQEALLLNFKASSLQCAVTAAVLVQAQ